MARTIQLLLATLLSGATITAGFAPTYARVTSLGETKLAALQADGKNDEMDDDDLSLDAFQQAKQQQQQQQSRRSRRKMMNISTNSAFKLLPA